MPIVRPNVHRYIDYTELTEKPVTAGDLMAVLSRINVQDVIRLVSLLNNALIDREGPVREHQGLLAKHFLEAGLFELLQRSDWRTDPKAVTVFHQQQLLRILKLGLLCCPHEGGLTGVEANHAFGQSCLMMNSLLGAQSTSGASDEPLINDTVKMVPVLENAMDTAALAIIGRATKLWVDIPKEFADDQAVVSSVDYIDIQATFRSAYGFEIIDFLEVTYALYAYVSAFDPAEDGCDRYLRIDERVFLGTGSYPVETFSKVVAILKCDYRELGNQLTLEPTQSLLHDLTPLYRYPLIGIDEFVSYCPDRSLLIKTLIDQVYWLVVQALDTRGQGAFRRFFGKVYARYLERIVTATFGPPPTILAPRYLFGPKFKNSQSEMSDALVDAGKTLVMFEFKGSLMRKDAKYSGSAHSLLQELVDKFANEKRGAEKGVTQLAKHIGEFTNGKPLRNEHIKAGSYTRILPVLVSYDATVTIPHIPQFLQGRFEKALTTALVPEHFSIGPVTVLDSRAFEVLEVLVRHVDLADLLENYQQETALKQDDGSTARLTSFWDYVTQQYNGLIRDENSLLWQANLELHKRVLTRMFGDPSEPPVNQ
jgi:hypothetical protein